MEAQEIKRRFETLYDAESDAVFRFCLFKTSDRDVALDLTQEAFTRMWDKMIQGGWYRSERAFLFTIARNLIIDWYRTKKRTVSLDSMVEKTWMDDYKIGEEVFSSGDGQIEIEMSADARLMVEKIKILPSIYQQAVYLRFVDDLSPQEIAGIVGLSANVVSVRITRGLEQLRNLYGKG